MRPDKIYSARQLVQRNKLQGLKSFACCKNKSKKPKSLDDVKEDFRHNTTLLGIQHILRKKSILWTLAYLCCVGMSIYQSWSVTLDFILQKTHQKYSVENTNLLPFPSVTICNGVVLPGDFNMADIPDFDVNVDGVLNISTCGDDKAVGIWEEIMHNNTRAIVRYRRGLSESKRIELSGGPETFISKCKFDGSRCLDFNNSNEFLIFNNPYFGTCATFNPAFTSDSAKTKDVHARLFVELELSKTGVQLDTGKPRAGVLIHAPGTAPVLSMAAVQDIYDQQSMAFTLRMMDKKFMARKQQDNTMSCIDHTDLSYRQKSRYYDRAAPYLYSVRACMKTCEQVYMRRDCSVNDVTGPVPSDDAQRKNEAEDYFVYLPHDTCDVQAELDMTFCDCPLPCNYTQYSVTVDTAELQAPVCDKENGTKDTTPGSAEVMVYFVSNIYEKVEEEITISLSQYLGILGGNMSLWIGMCIISVLELFELSFNLLRAWRNTRALDNQMKKMTDPYDPPKPHYYITR